MYENGDPDRHTTNKMLYQIPKKTYINNERLLSKILLKGSLTLASRQNYILG